MRGSAKSQPSVKKSPVFTDGPCFKSVQCFHSSAKGGDTIPVYAFSANYMPKLKHFRALAYLLGGLGKPHGEHLFTDLLASLVTVYQKLAIWIYRDW